MPARSVDPLDRLIGRNIRAQRRRKQISQAALAHAIGVGCQQLQKYESAANRISAGRLLRIAATLDRPIAEFFDKGSVRGRETAPWCQSRRVARAVSAGEQITDETTRDENEHRK